MTASGIRGDRVGRKTDQVEACRYVGVAGYHREVPVVPLGITLDESSMPVGRACGRLNAARNGFLACRCRQRVGVERGIASERDVKGHYLICAHWFRSPFP